MIIKNQFRTIPKQTKQVSTYQPEYKKLGVTPEIANHTATRAASIPRNIRVNSGQNEDLAWIPKGKEFISNEKPAKDDEEVVIHKRSFVNESYEDGVNRNTPIAYDDVPDLPRSVVASSENDEVVGKFSDVLIGEFVLIFENEILGAGTYDEVTDAIEKILLSDETNSISPKSLIVFKRMQIMTGVLIKDV